MIFHNPRKLKWINKQQVSCQGWLDEGSLKEKEVFLEKNGIQILSSSITDPRLKHRSKGIDSGAAVTSLTNLLYQLGSNFEAQQMQKLLSSISNALPTMMCRSWYTESVLQMTLLMTALAKILFDFTPLALSIQTNPYTLKSSCHHWHWMSQALDLLHH